MKTLEEILKEEILKETNGIKYEHNITHKGIVKAIEHYSREQNKELIEMLELMCMDLEERGRGRGEAYIMAKELLNKYK